MPGPAPGTPQRPPLTDEERARIVELVKAGRSRNDIAREVGRGAATVTKVAQDAGLSFDRAGTVAATRARQVDLKAKRALLEEQLLDDAQRLRAQLWKPHTYFDWGGKDHTYAEKLMPEPTPADKLKLVQAAGQAIDRSLRLTDHDAGRGSDAVRSLLGGVAQALGLHTPDTGDDPADHPTEGM